MLIKKIGNNVLMERAGSMKKTLTIVCALFVASLPSFAENYQFVQSNEDVMYQTYNTAKKDTKDVLKEDKTNTTNNNAIKRNESPLLSIKKTKIGYNRAKIMPRIFKILLVVGCIDDFFDCNDNILQRPDLLKIIRLNFLFDDFL